MPFKSEKQRKWMWANDPEMAQEWEDEEKLEEEKEATNPKMKKKDLVEYIKSKKMVNEQDRDQYDFPRLNEITGQERRDIMKYFEMLRQSGLTNMFGAHPILNWTKDDLHRWLYGMSNDIESLERKKEDLEHDIENEGEDSGIYESELESLEEQIEIINYLLDNKQQIRDVLIRAALNRIENTNGNHEMDNVQRVFQKMAKEAWRFWVGIQSIN